jgi:hypothetical protein
MRRYQIVIDGETIHGGSGDFNAILVRITEDDGKQKTISYED